MAIPALDTNAKNWVEVASWPAAVLAGLFGVWKIIVEMTASREQRIQELRWRKARAAKDLNEEMLDNPGSKAAMTMLDWDGREFEVKPGLVRTVSEIEMLASLRTAHASYSDKEAFVRDAFDNLFYYLGLFEHHVRQGLVDFSDLEYPVDYYVKLLAKHRGVFEQYLTAYGFSRGYDFLKRFAEWRDAPATTVQSPSDKPLQPTSYAGG